MLESLGLEQLTVRTNLRDFADKRWYLSAGAGVASCMMLFGNYFRYGITASSESFEYLMPHAFSPLTSTFLSSNIFTQVQDGGAYSRLDKIKTISSWPEAMRSLRVCLKTSQSQADKNCGKCGKCVRTLLGFRVLGLPLPKSLDFPVTDKQIAELNVDAFPSIARVQLIIMRDILVAAREKQITETWVSALESAIMRNQNRAGNF
jgi:hypothetical protein